MEEREEREEFVIENGPSKLDLMLSLFDADKGVRTVSFMMAQSENQPGFSYDVAIISTRRRHPTATIWDIEGITKTQGGKRRVSIYYLSDTRRGYMRFEKNLRTHSIIGTPSDTKQAQIRDSLREWREGVTYDLFVRWNAEGGGSHGEGGGHRVELFSNGGVVQSHSFFGNEDRLYGYCLGVVEILNKFGINIDMPKCLGGCEGSRRLCADHSRED